MSQTATKEQVHELSEEIKKEKAGESPPEMLAETAVQEARGRGPIVDELRREQEAGGGELNDALKGTGLENGPDEDGGEGEEKSDIDC